MLSEGRVHHSALEQDHPRPLVLDEENEGLVESNLEINYSLIDFLKQRKNIILTDKKVNIEYFLYSLYFVKKNLVHRQKRAKKERKLDV